MSEAAPNGGTRSAFADLARRAAWLLHERQIQKALDVSDELVALFESETDPAVAMSYGDVLTRHARSLMRLRSTFGAHERLVLSTMIIQARARPLVTKLPQRPRMAVARLIARLFGRWSGWSRFVAAVRDDQMRHKQAIKVTDSVVTRFENYPDADDLPVLDQARFVRFQAKAALHMPFSMYDVRGRGSDPVSAEAAVVRRFGGSDNEFAAVVLELMRALMTDENTDLDEHRVRLTEFIESHSEDHSRKIRTVVALARGIRGLEDIQIRIQRRRSS